MLTQTGNKPVTKSRLVKVETFFAIMTLPIIMYRKNLTAQQCAILYKPTAPQCSHDMGNEELHLIQNGEKGRQHQT